VSRDRGRRDPSRVADGLVAQVFAGSHQAAARLISLVEDGEREGLEALRTLYPRTGKAYTVGITGPPGAGKSTLVDALTKRIRAAGETVGIIAIDPTSPFTGGALLGDRVRMQDHATDPGVFVRSMATRGTSADSPPRRATSSTSSTPWGARSSSSKPWGRGRARSRSSPPPTP